ncbi:hypothetical protein, partial [Erwinia piriflorinigrans]|uniref:hypothetical protein n=1 Tax=Erwinia piriflorinigrans TaxID=665097 RepID=UPI001F121EE9
SLSPVGDRVGLAIDQIAQSGLSSLKVIYYSAQLFRVPKLLAPTPFTALFRAIAASLSDVVRSFIIDDIYILQCTLFIIKTPCFIVP